MGWCALFITLYCPLIHLTPVTGSLRWFRQFLLSDWGSLSDLGWKRQIWCKWIQTLKTLRYFILFVGYAWLASGSQECLKPKTVFRANMNKQFSQQARPRHQLWPSKGTILITLSRVSPWGSNYLTLCHHRCSSLLVRWLYEWSPVTLIIMTLWEWTPKAFLGKVLNKWHDPNEQQSATTVYLAQGVLRLYVTDERKTHGRMDVFARHGPLRGGPEKKALGLPASLERRSTCWLSGQRSPRPSTWHIHGPGAIRVRLSTPSKRRDSMYALGILNIRWQDDCNVKYPLVGWKNVTGPATVLRQKWTFNASHCVTSPCPSSQKQRTN